MPIESEVIIDGRLLGCQTRQVVARRVGLLAPVQAVGKERLPVHEEGRRAGKVATQLVEDAHQRVGAALAGCPTEPAAAPALAKLDRRLIIIIATGYRASRRPVVALRRPQGATNLQLMLATGWQPHSVRGAISGLLRKRLGLNVVLTRNADGERVYRIG